MSKWVWLVVFWVSMIIQPIGVQAVAQPDVSRIIVNLPSRTLELYKGDTLIKEYPVAIGKPSTPTPTGTYSVIEKEVNPTWYPPGKGYNIPPGPDNPLGARWLGFVPLYGIHGTNAPWSIGLAVSNGCIRMQEEDVEELFELVEDGATVTVEYERIKVRVGNNGQATIGIYPDVYGRQAVTLKQVRQRLRDAGLDGLVDDTFLKGLIQNSSAQQIAFAQLHNLKINGMLRPERAVSWQGEKLVPVMALADSLHTSVTWNERQQTLTRQFQSVPGLKLGNTVYTDIKYLPALFGGREKWNDKQNCLELTLPIAKFGGQLLSGDIQCVNNALVVPALPLAAVLGERVTWQPQIGTLYVHGKPAPIIIMAGQPFLAIEDIGKIYNTAAVWDEKEQTLALTYPLHVVDYSTYLDPDECFLISGYLPDPALAATK
ncbi:L,D-transpeptidase [Sporomusa aerivorans]|uniref:L,D-transpeptidase n=1 Tax=Sporomusa aerivorans TaxID=204936 RepID=UPI00352B5034